MPKKAEEPIFVGGKKAVYEKMLDTLQIIGKPFTTSVKSKPPAP